MTRRNSLPMTAEDVEKHNARVRSARRPLSAATMAARGVLAVDDELRSLGVPIDLLLDKGVVAKADLPSIHATAMAALKRTRMNKTEAEWAAILEARKRAGEIIWYQFEGLRLRLANGAYFTPDFPVLTKEGQLEFQEVKGFWREAAKLRIRVAASLYPFWKFYAIRKKRKKDGGEWDIEEF